MKRSSFGVILESIDSKMDMVLEAVDSTRTELKMDMSEFRAEVNQRFDRLLEAFRTE